MRMNAKEILYRRVVLNLDFFANLSTVYNTLSILIVGVSVDIRKRTQTFLMEMLTDEK